MGSSAVGKNAKFIAQMTEYEKIALIAHGISSRVEHYERVKELQNKPLRHIETETGYSLHFITKCRKIAGWTRRKIITETYERPNKI